MAHHYVALKLLKVFDIYCSLFQQKPHNKPQFSEHFLIEDVHFFMKVSEVCVCV